MGGNRYDGFGGFDGSEEHLALLSLVQQNTGRRGPRHEATVTALAVMADSGMTATALKLNPFPSS